MKVKHKDDNEKGIFYIEIENQTEAKMTYIWAGTDRIIIDHTEVSTVLKGQGAGKLLVAKAVEFARAKSIIIVPLCPFAKSVFAKTPEFNDVL